MCSRWSRSPAWDPRLPKTHGCRHAKARVTAGSGTWKPTGFPRPESQTKDEPGGVANHDRPEEAGKPPPGDVVLRLGAGRRRSGQLRGPVISSARASRTRGCPAVPDRAKQAMSARGRMICGFISATRLASDRRSPAAVSSRFSRLNVATRTAVRSPTLPQGSRSYEGVPLGLPGCGIPNGVTWPELASYAAP
jgi:hypothetical protein